MAGGVAVLEAGVLSAGAGPRCGVVLGPSRPGQLHSVGRLMAEQRRFVLPQKIHIGRNKEGLVGLRSGKRSMHQSRELLLRLLFSLMTGQSVTESDQGRIIFPQAKLTCGTHCQETSEAQS